LSDDSYLDQSNFLPKEVVDWAGLTGNEAESRASACDQDGWDIVLDHSGDSPDAVMAGYASGMNDNGKSFAEIADAIEEGL
jgi:hypothetical protein